MSGLERHAGEVLALLSLILLLTLLDRLPPAPVRGGFIMPLVLQRRRGVAGRGRQLCWREFE